jgi:Spy/CpxP family protein refolding chaperone
MKRILKFGVPIAVVAIFLTAAVAYSFGSRHRSPGVAKDFMMYRLDKLSKELNLTPDQQAKMDSFKQDLGNTIDQKFEKRKEVRDAIRAELSKPNPDITKIQPLIDQQIDDMAQSAHQMVGRMSEFYGQLTPDQQKILTQHFLDRMDDHHRSND